MVLATGGFANNRDMLPDSVANIVYYGPVSSTGDGHAMAMAVGGQIANTDWIAIKPTVWIPATVWANIRSRPIAALGADRRDFRQPGRRARNG